jgi:soluble lytic murein transglycosylase-like protein
VDFAGSTRRCLTLAALLALAALAPAASRAETNHVETAGLPSPGEPVSNFQVPQPLKPDDVARYKRIFDLQKDGHWHAADALIAKLHNRILMGHVLAQRYLHPTKYRSHYKELAGWLKAYADLPEARRVYELALRRKPARAKPPQAPIAPRLTLPDESDLVDNGTSPDDEVIGTTIEAAQLRATPAGHRSAHSRTHRSAVALWSTGLADYRRGRFLDAAGRFEAMAAAPRLSDWDQAAAAFWAARSNLVARRPERVNRWLNVAAEHPRTFYGLIARRMLGLDSGLTWDHPRLDRGELSAIIRGNAARRAMALVQVGQTARAASELRQIAATDDPDVRLVLIALADELHLPSLALSASKSLAAAGGQVLDRGLYPLPSWAPKGGFTVDRALLYAFMRQESAFNVTATSPAGARGLMQLMPATAAFMASANRHRTPRGALYDPAINMELGQRYLRYLIDHDQVQGDLFLLAAAYNGGPGNLAKWQKRMGSIANDPLLFLESIPTRETRLFTEHVLANLWIYRERLGQSDPSLDAIAAGDRPVYKAQDSEAVVSASNGGN